MNFDPKRTALLTIDLQNDFLHPEGAYGRAGQSAAAIAALPEEQRTAVVLCDIHGFAYDEIAAMTGWPMGTVKSRINRARVKIREILLQRPELLPPSFRPNTG